MNTPGIPLRSDNTNDPILCGLAEGVRAEAATLDALEKQVQGAGAAPGAGEGAQRSEPRRVSERGLAYARVYADGKDGLDAKLAALSMLHGGAARERARAQAPRPRQEEGQARRRHPRLTPRAAVHRGQELRSCVTARGPLLVGGRRSARRSHAPSWFADALKPAAQDITIPQRIRVPIAKTNLF